MEKIVKVVLSVAVIIVLCAGAFAFLQNNSAVEYEDIRPNEYVTLSVPKSDDARYGNDSSEMFKYIDSKYNLTITVMHLDQLSGMEKFREIFDKACEGAFAMNDQPKGFYFNEETGMYTVGWYHNDEFIIVQCNNLTIARHIYDTAKYSDGSNNTDNSTSTESGDSGTDSSNGKYDTCIQCGKQFPGTGVRILCDSCKADRYEESMEMEYESSTNNYYNYGGNGNGYGSGSSSGSSAGSEEAYTT